MKSANKVLVQRRLKQAGMRWSVEKSQNVVSLRAKVESGKIDIIKPMIEIKIEEDYENSKKAVA